MVLFVPLFARSPSSRSLSNRGLLAHVHEAQPRLPAYASDSSSMEPSGSPRELLRRGGAGCEELPPFPPPLLLLLLPPPPLQPPGPAALMLLLPPAQAAALLPSFA